MQRIMKYGDKFVLLQAIGGTKSNWQNNVLAWYPIGWFETMQEAKDSSFMYLV